MGQYFFLRKIIFLLRFRKYKSSSKNVVPLVSLYLPMLYYIYLLSVKLYSINNTIYNVDLMWSKCITFLVHKLFSLMIGVFNLTLVIKPSPFRSFIVECWLSDRKKVILVLYLDIGKIFFFHLIYRMFRKNMFYFSLQ